MNKIVQRTKPILVSTPPIFTANSPHHLRFWQFLASKEIKYELWRSATCQI